MAFLQDIGILVSQQFFLHTWENYKIVKKGISKNRMKKDNMSTGPYVSCGFF